MSGKGNPGCKRKNQGCSAATKDTLSCAGGGKKRGSSKHPGKTPAGTCLNPIPPCNNNDDEVCGILNNSNGNDVPSTSRHSQLRQTENPLSTVEAEVDRLVDAAKQFSEKEKLKLKQFYEEEIMKKKKAVIQEFRCAMEREVIAPLKMKLCQYEKELEELKAKYEKAVRMSGQMSLTSPSLSQFELDVLQKELKKAHEEKDSLDKLIHQEIRRKSLKSGVLIPEEPEEEDEPYEQPEVQQEVVPTQETEVKRTSEGSKENEGEEPTADTEDGQDIEKPKPSGILKPTEPVPAPPPKPVKRKTLKYNEEGKLLIAYVDHHEVHDEEDNELPDDTKKLKQKIVELSKALQQAKMFAEEEINELIKEQQLREELERTLASIQNENMSLRNRIDEWLLAADVLENGEIGEENSKLRQRIQELENERSRGSIEAELKRLKDELDGLVVEGRKSAELERRKSSYKPPPPEPEPEPEPVPELQPESPRKSKDSDPEPFQCPKCPSIDYEEFSSPFVERIKGLEDRIHELEDQLLTFSEMEARIKELQAEADELVLVKQKLDEVSKEYDDLRNTPPPKCPIEEDELNELKKKLEDTEHDLNSTKEEWKALMMKTGELESKNVFLAKSVAQFEQEHEEHLRLEEMHAKMLEEKRRRSEEAKQLAETLARVEEDDERAHRELEDTRHHLDEMESSLKLTQEENDTLHTDLEKVKKILQKEQEEQRRLRDDITKKEVELKKLQAALDSEKKEVEELKKEIEEMRDRCDDVKRHRDQLEKDLGEARKHMELMEKDFTEKLKEQARKAQEQCSELSSRGKCILEHEQKCLKVTTQLAQDNMAMHERIGQLEQQLEQMANMENATRNMFREISELQKRAEQRTVELEELKKLPETCQLNTTPSFTSPIQSLPSLPIPSDERFVSNTIRKSKPGPSKKKGNEECTILTKKMRELEAEREALNNALKDKLQALESVQRELDDVNQEGSKLKSELDRACNEK